MSAMSSDMALEEMDREKHRNCDRWGHCKPMINPLDASFAIAKRNQEQREHRTLAELAIWLLIALAAVWMLAQFGIVKP